MSDDLTFTGERFVPGVGGEIVYEHVHRYAFARRYADGKRVLDAACGEGYGSALLATVAREVTGVDIDEPTIAHARQTYQAIGNLTFVKGSATELPLPDASVDRVLSSLMLHHLDEDERGRALREVRRVLRPGGQLHVVDIDGGPARRSSRGGRMHRHPLVAASTPERLLAALREAGLTAVAENGRQRTRFGACAFYRAER